MKEGDKKVFLDVMLNDRFYCQLCYEYCPLFKISDSEIKEFVLKKRPLLKGKDFEIKITNLKVSTKR